MRELCEERANLTYLTHEREPVTVAPGAAVVGDDGWADARIGDFANSMIRLNDYRYIEELADREKNGAGRGPQPLGRPSGGECPTALGRGARGASRGHLRHARPAIPRGGVVRRTNLERRMGASLYLSGGRRGSTRGGRQPPRLPDYLFSAATLTEPARPRLRKNLLVLTGGAEYGRPEMQRTFTWDV